MTTRVVPLLVAVEAGEHWTAEAIAQHVERCLSWALSDGALRPVSSVAWVRPVPLRPGFEVKPSLDGADTEGHDDEPTEHAT